jgi:thiamine-phosphate pyrophosphorylase
MKRAQEAVRCLEEFSKLIRPKLGQKFKQIRFLLYELEKVITPKIIKAAKLDFDLYVIVDSSVASFRVFRKAIAGGVKIIQLRDKIIDKKKYFAVARKMARMARRAGVVFILNDYWDLANRVGADGVHLGQDDFKRVGSGRLRKELGDEAIIGISASSLSEALKAQKMGADYVGVGPIFSTPIKPGLKPLGMGLLRRIVRKVKVPVVAIGGIDRTNVNKVRQARCRRVAVIRAAHELIGYRSSVIIG